ncbi:nucleotidyltransferase family protein [Phototrophicus methaneseepsis]|uniref:Nucleotidyltransferase family protein n=1 Tax=Phototrophicus methaneseepsis TaxID=2710758 RepID=A0A7S8IGP3_9CHLR|nr:nucleotidyltransferase family protein [Phototrophicus methaneseepsis]QPC85006.1 nucleotidyltransferase family protein [Phototrophicus methaneseepsis]
MQTHYKTQDLPIPLEARFLIDCLKVSLQQADQDVLETYADAAIDWDYVLELTNDHLVYPLVYEALKDTFADVMPEEIRSQYQAIYMQNKLQSIVIMQELKRIVTLLADEGIMAVPVKGPLLSQVYPEPSLRSVGDLDISIARNQIERAVDILMANGYVKAVDMSAGQERLWIETRQGYELDHPDLNVSLDIHSDITSGRSPIMLPRKQMLKYLQEVQIDDVTMHVPTLEYLFFFLCIHGTKHLWMQFKSLCDLSQFLFHYENRLDWRWIRKMARRRSGEKMIYLSLYMCERIFNAPVPAEVRADYPDEIIAIGDRLIESWLFVPGCTRFEITKIKLTLLGNVMNQLDYFLRLVWIPQKHNMPNLPEQAAYYPVYYVIRPFQLAWNMLFKEENKMFSTWTE